jgi:hypothetical protein
MRTDRNETKRRLAGHGDNFSTANCWTKIPAVYNRKFGIFRGISKCLFIHSMNSREIPNDVPRNPGSETLVQVVVNTVMNFRFL